MEPKIVFIFDSLNLTYGSYKEILTHWLHIKKNEFVFFKYKIHKNIWRKNICKLIV